MHKNIVLLNYIFRANDTNLSGQIFMPVIDNVVYKPIKFTINSGNVCDSFKNLKGENAIDKRNFKNRLIKEHTAKTGMIGVYKINKEFEMTGKLGFVKIASLLSGFNTNMNSNLILITKDTSWKNPKLGQLFRNASSYKGYTKGLKIISFYEFSKKYSDLIDFIKNSYSGTYKSITKITKER